MRTEQELVKFIEANLQLDEIKVLRDRNVAVILPEQHTLNALGFFKSNGYGHLSTISCVDWLQEGQFELVYHLFSYEDRIQLYVKTRIDREKGSFVTCKGLWPVARFYERDIHDFFGVTFAGNDDLEELILENWHDLPPMRKDFDTRKYVEKKYEWRDYRGQKYAD